MWADVEELWASFSRILSNLAGQGQGAPASGGLVGALIDAGTAHWTPFQKAALLLPMSKAPGFSSAWSKLVIVALFDRLSVQEQSPYWSTQFWAAAEPD